MSLRVKAGIDLEELKKYGFKTGKEWADAGERCLEGIGYKYQHEWYHKFLMDADEPSKIAYIAEDYDIPCVQISKDRAQRFVCRCSSRGYLSCRRIRAGYCNRYYL